MRKKSNPLELKTRRAIYSIVRSSPGLHFRELQRRAGLAVGALQYHIDYMKKQDLLIEDKEGGYSRFYIRGELADDEKALMAFLRQASVRRILIALLENPRATYDTIISSTGHSPSTVSWHMGRLLKAGVISKSQKGMNNHFMVVNKNLVLKLLIAYKESFLDRALDRFIDSWARDNRGFD